jgi:hypothetical protein
MGAFCVCLLLCCVVCYCRPNVVCTPHLGASTTEAQEGVSTEVAEAVVDALQGKLAATAVNAPMVSPEVLKELAPYVTLAEALGKVGRDMLCAGGMFCMLGRGEAAALRTRRGGGGGEPTQQGLAGVSTSNDVTQCGVLQCWAILERAATSSTMCSCVLLLPWPECFFS